MSFGADPPGPPLPAVAPSEGLGERRASWLELFFDLVFVVAVAALAAQLHSDHSVSGLAVFAGLFVPVWWAWMGYTWYATTFDNDGPVFRMGMLAGMLATAALSSGVAGAASRDSQTFVIAYACLFYILSALYAWAWLRVPEARGLSARFTIGNAIGATLWLSSLALDETRRPFVWAAAMLLLITTFVFGGWEKIATALRPFDPKHVAERYGLFTIVVLGESVVVTVAGLDTGARFAAVLVAVLGFVLAATVWWLYFGLFASMPVAHGVGGRFVWAQGHFLVFAGIAAAAVGVEFAVEAAALGAALTPADRLPLAAGLAAYMAAMAAIRAANRSVDRIVMMRLTTAGIVLALGLAGLGLGPLAFVAIVAALLVGEAVIELMRRRAASPATAVQSH
ncbi:MAG: low temperature requirement protein A [Pseudonocardia sp.]